MAHTTFAKRTPHVPTEIVDLIHEKLLDHYNFPSDQRRDMQKFRLVSKMFAEIGAKSLFSSIQFNTTGTKTRIIELSQSKHSTCLKHLTIKVEPVLDQNSPDFTPVVHSRIDLPAFSNLQRLMVSFEDNHSEFNQSRTKQEMEYWVKETRRFVKESPNINDLRVFVPFWAIPYAVRIIADLPGKIRSLVVRYEVCAAAPLGQSSESWNGTLPAEHLDLQGPGRTTDLHRYYQSNTDLKDYTAPNLRHLELGSLAFRTNESIALFLRSARILKSLKMFGVFVEDFHVAEALFNALSQHKDLVELNICYLNVKTRLSANTPLASYLHLSSLRSLKITRSQVALEHLCGLIHGCKSTVTNIELNRLTVPTANTSDWITVFDAMLDCPNLNTVFIGDLSAIGDDAWDEDVWARTATAEQHEMRLKFDTEQDARKTKASFELPMPQDYTVLVADAGSRSVDHKLGELVRLLHSRNKQWCIKERDGRASALACLAGYYASLCPLAGIAVDTVAGPPGLQIEEIADENDH